MPEDETEFIDPDEFADRMILLQINSGLFVNFFGSLVVGQDIEFTVAMVEHFLNGMVAGPHPSILDFKVLSVDLLADDRRYELVVQVRNGPCPAVWHTHIIRCNGDLPSEEDIVNPDGCEE